MSDRQHFGADWSHSLERNPNGVTGVSGPMGIGVGDIMKKFSVRLREIRVQQNKKQREAAEVLGMKLRGYQAYEGGEREPSIEKLIKLADYFDVTLDYLMGRTDE